MTLWKKISSLRGNILYKYILVTGKSGSGKSTISKALAKELDYEYLDVDKVQHMIYEDTDILNRTIEMFGSDIFDKNGNVDRKKLGKLVFSDPDKDKVQAFNDMAWVYIEKYVDNLLSSDKPYVIDWILSPITKYWDMPAYKVYVQCDSDEDRFSRIASRDNVDIEYIKNRDKASVDFSKYTFDYVLVNKDISSLDNYVLDIINNIKK